MKVHTFALGLLALNAAAAQAGGIDRSGQGLGVLFEPGNYVEGSFSQVSPNVTGMDVANGATGSVVSRYPMASLSAKLQVSPTLSVALVMDQPYGAKLLYANSTPLLGGTQVDVSSSALLGLARWHIHEHFSLHGGLRVQQANAEVRLQGLAYGPVSGYRVQLASDTSYSPVVGMAYELPHIGMRVVGTYHAATVHNMPTHETGGFAMLNGQSTTRINTPRAINLDFQTGLASSTLLFGQLRWVNWSEFRVDPQRFMAVTGEGLIELRDSRGYTLGLAQRLSSRWSGAASLHHEAKGAPLVSPLSPVNGRRGATLAAIFTEGRLRVSAGLSYMKLGDAMLETGTPDTQRAAMQGNHTVGVGVTVGWAL